MKHFLLLAGLMCANFISTAFTITLEPMDASCGNNNGSITIVIVGGTAPYSYLWTGGITTQNLTNLAPGTYTVTVTDQMGSSATDSATINNTTEIMGGALTYVIPPQGLGLTHPCNDLCNGIAYVSVWSMNGTPPYNVGTSLGHTIGFYAPFNCPTVEGICSDDVYTVFVSDALGCTGTAGPTFPYAPTSFAMSTTIASACMGLANGEAILTLLNNQGIWYEASWIGPDSGVVNGFGPDLIMSQLLPGNYTVTMVNTYSAPPCDTVFAINIPLASTCGTISGKVYLDTISNCLADASEPVGSSRIVKFTPGPYYGTTDSTGNYTASLPFGTYDATTISNSYITPICSVSGINLNAVNDSITGIDLGDSSNSVLDLTVSLMSGPARPGFNFQLYATVNNNAFTTVPNPTVLLDFDPVLTLISSTVPHIVTGPNQIELQMPQANGFTMVQAQLLFSVPPNPSLIGQQMTNQALVNANMPEANTTNNTDILQQIITGSYDPNDKAVWPSFDLAHTYLADVDSLLRYTIQFQNTGTDTAFTIVVVDTISEFLDITSLNVLGSSHPCTWEITGQNILRVTYDNILLPDSNTNEPASHGLFSFSITHLPSILLQPLPYLLENIAAIYFDFNPPIITNAAFSTVDLSVGISETTTDGIRLYPNPAGDEVIVVCNNPELVNQIIITDLPGKRVGSWKPAGERTVLQIDGLSPGLYLVTLEGNGQRQVRKLIKK